jgi:hypothetical protein
MLGTRNIFHKFGKISKVDNISSPHVVFLLRLYQQAKQISQIIAYIWRWVDDTGTEEGNVANELKTYFEQPILLDKCQPNARHLKSLFRANPRKGDPQFPHPAYLLKKVFEQEGLNNKEYIFPIFDDLERGDDGEHPELGYSFEVTFSSFVGEILDADNNNPQLFTMIIPFPPRPQIGNATLSEETLDDWIKNREEDEYFSKNPYIPTTCS